MDKNQIRIQYLAKRQRLAPEAAMAACEAINASIFTLISGSATVLAGYRPIRGEVDVTDAMRRCGESGMRLCLPVIEAPDSPLYFRRWRPGETLEKGRYGVDVPPAGAPIAKPDTILVPLVAFDRTGQRLGYGAGYYDRTIRTLRAGEKPPRVIGVAYAMQETAHIPLDSFDEKLDMIVTENEILRIPS